MAEGVAGAIDARAFAVPHGEDAVVLALAAQFGLLRAPDRGGGKILVDAALKADIAFLQKRCSAEELTIEAGEWRPAITAHIARRVETVAPVDFLLHQAQPHQRLETGDKNLAVAEIVFVVELDVAKRHRGTPAPSLPPYRRFCQGSGAQSHIGLGRSATSAAAGRHPKLSISHTENRLRRGKARHGVLAQRAKLCWTMTGKL